MEDFIDIDIPVSMGAESGKIRQFRGKCVGHSQCFQNRFQLCAVLAGELGQGRVYGNILGIRQKIMEFFPGEWGCIIIDVCIFAGKQCGKRIFIISIIFKKAWCLSVLQILIFFWVHKIHFLLSAVLSRKRFLIDLGIEVNGFPLGLKRQGVYQIHDSIIRNLCENLRNHFVCIFFHPLVNPFDCGTVKSVFIDVRAVPVSVCLQEVLLYCEFSIIFDPDGIGSAEFVFVRWGQCLDKGGQIGVQFFAGHAQHLFHLFFCGFPGSVLSHTQGRDHRQRGD